MLSSFLSRISELLSSLKFRLAYRLQYLLHALLNYSVYYRPELLLHQRYGVLLPVLQIVAVSLLEFIILIGTIPPPFFLRLQRYCPTALTVPKRELLSTFLAPYL